MAVFVAAEQEWRRVERLPYLHARDGTQYLLLPRPGAVRAWVNGVEAIWIQVVKTNALVTVEEEGRPPLTFVVGCPPADTEPPPPGSACEFTGLAIPAGKGFRCPNCRRAFGDDVRAVVEQCPACQARLAHAPEVEPEEVLR